MSSETGRSRPAAVQELSRATLARLRTFAVDTARGVGLDSEAVNRLAIVVDEAMANALRYAGGGLVSITAAVGLGVTVEVRDDGPGIPPGTSVVMPGPLAVGGRGLPLIHLLSDDLEIRTGPAGTTVRLTVGARTAG
jgi:serine/threonine-protein kinase RsbW